MININELCNRCNRADRYINQLMEEIVSRKRTATPKEIINEPEQKVYTFHEDPFDIEQRKIQELFDRIDYEEPKPEIDIEEYCDLRDRIRDML